ncbi:MAG: phosphatidylglycerophosphatase A [Zetaproteobacteria bacterium]|nr:phosphatidylglycerophosphatase A [Zetaproteobacteria bacterium]
MSPLRNKPSISRPKDLITLRNHPYKFSFWVAAGFGSGWLPKAPGTWGSLAALIPLYMIAGDGSLAWFSFALFFTVIGCFICAVVLPQLTNHDPGWIVIDEWAGLGWCVALNSLFIDHLLLLLLLSFLSFRLFDIWKPWPISWVEKQGPDWWSIMADDLVAGMVGSGLLFMIVAFI